VPGFSPSASAFRRFTLPAGARRGLVARCLGEFIRNKPSPAFDRYGVRGIVGLLRTDSGGLIGRSGEDSGGYNAGWAGSEG